MYVLQKSYSEQIIMPLALFGIQYAYIYSKGTYDIRNSVSPKFKPLNIRLQLLFINFLHYYISDNYFVFHKKVLKMF